MKLKTFAYAGLVGLLGLGVFGCNKSEKPDNKVAPVETPKEEIFVVYGSQLVGHGGYGVRYYHIEKEDGGCTGFALYDEENIQFSVRDSVKRTSEGKYIILGKSRRKNFRCQEPVGYVTKGTSEPLRTQATSSEVIPYEQPFTPSYHGMSIDEINASEREQRAAKERMEEGIRKTNYGLAMQQFARDFSKEQADKDLKKENPNEYKNDSIK